jgi:glycerol-3-phosphate acyltransferase PlsX
VLTRLAAAVVYPVLLRFRGRIDPRHYNGATLVGLKGVVVKSHGGADLIAFANALRRAHTEVEHGVLDRISQRIAEMHAIAPRANGDTPGPLRAHA